MLHYMAWGIIAKHLRHSRRCSQTSDNLQIHEFAVSYAVNKDNRVLIDFGQSFVITMSMQLP